MHTSARSGLKEGLEKEINGKVYRELFEKLKTTCSVLEDFGSWQEVVAFATSGDTGAGNKQALLKALLVGTRCNRDPGISAALILMFWPQLSGLFGNSRRYDPDDYELWQNIVTAYLEALNELDVQGQGEYLIAWICYDVKHRLHRLYRQRWQTAERESCCPPDGLEDLAGGYIDPAFEKLEARDEHWAELHRLRGHVRAGRITEADFLLLVATRLYGCPIAECALRIGISRELAKKRKQRIEASLSLPAIKR